MAEKKAAPVEVTGQAKTQATADDVAAKGYSGIKPDGPANETFTLAGVTSDNK